MLAEDEIRPYLNSQLYTCRLLSKALPTSASDQAVHQVQFLVESYKRYEVLKKLIEQVCKTKNLTVDDFGFGQEATIVSEMCNLLPAKLDNLLRGRR